MVDLVSTVSTVAGSLEHGFRDGRGKNVKFCNPVGLDFSGDGGILVADCNNHCIRKVVLKSNSPTYVETFAGIPGESGCKDGDASQALFHYPRSVTVSSDGTVYVADTSNYRIRKIDGSRVSSLAGSGQRGTADGKGNLASFFDPYDITCVKHHRGGGYYVSDYYSIRHVTDDGTVSTVAGTPGRYGHQDGASRQAKFDVPHQLACASSGEIYVADKDSHGIRFTNADHSIVRTLVGANGSGFVEGTTETSKFNSPLGVAILDDGQCFVADTNNHRIRVISLSDGVQTVSTLVGSSQDGLEDGDGQHAKLKYPRHLLLDHFSNTLYFTQDHCLRKVSLPRKPLPQLEASLLQDMLSIVDNPRLSDVVFKVQEQPIYASKVLLRLRSKYFNHMFSSGMKESVQTIAAVTEVSMKDVDYKSFKSLIVYLMTDKLEADTNDYKTLYHLLVVSDQFMVDRLKFHCERLLERHIEVDNVFELVHLAVSSGAEHLKAATLRYITQHRELRQRPEMEQLPPKFLVNLLKHF